MKFAINRDDILSGIQLVAGVVERRQTLPVLSNALLILEEDSLSVIGTDLEVEIRGRVAVSSAEVEGAITVPARKLLDIVKSLEEDAEVGFQLDGDRMLVTSGRSRFTLSTLPASDFPNVEEGEQSVSFELGQAKLKALIERTAFSMAQQDVRFYLNGMLFELSPEQLRLVATDGHRLAMTTETLPTSTTTEVHQAILPRKGVLELARLLADSDATVQVELGTNHVRVETADYRFTSKLVDGKFPDYERVLPKGLTKFMVADREAIKQSFNRAAILSNEKYRGVRVQIEEGVLKITANNPEQEQAEEELSVQYTGDAVEIGFNVSYVLDVLNTIKAKSVKFSLNDGNSSSLV
ncbi:UNVERIFIED_CONTAM: hypothetical protein GTU68_027486, partial [Idotea baltica]|nr:hypothetical protein [Idotea baltica]